MEFDKSKVYTSLNADEVKVGSIGFAGDSIKELKHKVEHDSCFYMSEIVSIEDENHLLRFGIKTPGSIIRDKIFPLFYLVEEPKEKELRPYSSTEECISIHIGATLVRKSDGAELMITGKTKQTLYLGPAYWVDMQELFTEYEWPNGSPCGVEEN